MNFDGKTEALERDEAKKATAPAVRRDRGVRTQNSKAAKAEALKDGVDFEFDGKTYHLPPAEDWDLDVMEHFSDGNMILASKALFEEKQWQDFRTDEKGVKKKRTNKDLSAFIEVAMSSLGVEPGESSS